MLAPTSTTTADRELQNALALAQNGHKQQAVDTLRGLLARTATHVQARCMLGLLLHELGQSPAALAELDRAQELARHDALVQELRATVLLALSRAADAETAARAALAIDPGRYGALLQLGVALEAQHRAADALEPLRKAVAMRTDAAPARRALVRCLLLTGAPDAALEIAAHPSLLADESQARAVVTEFAAAGAGLQQLALAQMAVEYYPNSYEWIMRIAAALHRLGRSSEALTWSEQAHALRPAELAPQEMRAVGLIDRGEVEAGLALYRSLLTRAEIGAESGNRHLILAHYEPGVDNAVLFQMHADWVRRHVHAFGEPFRAALDPQPQQVLRIGWLSPRFAEGPVASFLSGLLEAFDRRTFRHVLVPLLAHADAATQRLQQAADEWLPLHGIDAAALLRRLRAARLDIAIDLAGHSFGNRLNVLAQRVAPLQLCWLDYFNTTGVAAMDGWIGDAWLTPDDGSQRFTERVLRLASGRFCYSPADIAPSVDTSSGAHVRFGSFNRLAKLNDGVLDAWAEILRRTPESQLLLGAGLLGDGAARANLLSRFAARGIPAQRLSLHAQRPYAELLAAYREVDIALDPFPFSGCTTTCDALWMGVPVITLPGASLVSRQSASLLWRLCKDEWVARDRSDYVERAVALAARTPELRASRAVLREQVREHLCDATTHAREFAALLRELWREYCANRAR